MGVPVSFSREISLFCEVSPMKGNGSELAARGPILFARVAKCLLILAGLLPIALVAWYVVTQGSQGSCR